MILSIHSNLPYSFLALSEVQKETNYEEITKRMRNAEENEKVRKESR